MIIVKGNQKNALEIRRQHEGTDIQSWGILMRIKVLICTGFFPPMILRTLNKDVLG